ncbi:MAG TPA: hypothetical protein VGO64_09105 [Candidatus Limnocylindrales bacterium]|nr:hypothetical protein [Candidatus Limnocylindrales bacterium]
MADLGHASHDTIETIAAAVVVIGGAIFTAIAYRTRPARSGPAASLSPPSSSRTPAGRAARSLPRGATDADLSDTSRSVGLMMAGLSAGAAAIHLAAAPPHYAELGDLGAGFLASAAFQAWWAVRALGTPSRRLIDLGILVNVAIILTWAWTRTVGLPIGEFAGRAEPVGLPDGASIGFELGLVGLLVVRRLGLDAGLGPRSLGRTLASVAVVPVLGLVIVLTSLSAVAIVDGLDHGAVPGGPAEGHLATH